MTKVDTTILTPNKIYLYSSDMQQLPYGPYDNSTKVNEALALPAKKASRHWVNKEHLVYSVTLGISVYLVCHKVSTLMAGVVLNLVTGERTEFPSINSAIGYVNPAIDFSQFIRCHVLLSKPYISGDDAYLVEYLRLEDHESKEAMNKRAKAKYMAKYNPQYYARKKQG